MREKTLDELSEDLQKFAELEGTEVGEYWRILCDLSQKEYVMGDELATAVRKEIEDQLEYIAENCEIVEGEYQPSKVKITYLKFKND